MRTQREVDAARAAHGTAPDPAVVRGYVEHAQRQELAVRAAREALTLLDENHALRRQLTVLRVEIMMLRRDLAECLKQDQQGRHHE